MSKLSPSSVDDEDEFMGSRYPDDIESSVLTKPTRGSSSKGTAQERLDKIYAKYQSKKKKKSAKNIALEEESYGSDENRSDSLFDAKKSTSSKKPSARIMTEDEEDNDFRLGVHYF